MDKDERAAPKGMRPVNASGRTMQTSSAPRGTKIVSATGRDNSDFDVKKGLGGKMGGSITNLSHSLSGASAVQGPEDGKKG
jgi:hypothetical protein